MTTTDSNTKIIDLENNDCYEDISPLSGVLTPKCGAILKKMLEDSQTTDEKEAFMRSFSKTGAPGVITCKREDCGMKSFDHSVWILDTAITCSEVICWVEYADVMRVGLIAHNNSGYYNGYHMIAYCHVCNRVTEVADSSPRWALICKKLDIGTVVMTFKYFVERDDITLMFNIPKTTLHLLEHYKKLKPLGELYSEAKASKAADLCEEVISEANDLEESRNKKRKINK